MAKPKPPWAAYLNFDIGELNRRQMDFFSEIFDEDQDAFSVFAEMHRDRYSHNAVVKPGPYLAVVLKVLSGPQVNNEASTNGSNLTKAISLNNFKSAQIEEKERANKPQPLKVIARIPEIDADIDFPEDEDDEARMAAHGEFHQMHEDKKLEQTVPGSLIWVSFDSTENTTGFNGQPAGKILSLHDPGSFSQIEAQESSKESFNPPCKALTNLAAPGGGIYIGHTEPDPVLFMGPPIRKLKGRIKTGLFGNGTAQTKQHFDQCLQMAKPSAKHNIHGPAPKSTSGAFVWVGHLRNNGYMDSVNRPNDLGRETIIYAPGMLDLSVPIELKYYFHDTGGFGRSWAWGEETNIDDAISAVEGTEDNDFRDKIGPGIKDLIREGRNFVLVIPEMSYSRGYDDLDLPRWATQQFLTFDGTSEGGKFTYFHDEVINVLNRHFPEIDDDKIGYVSVLADGLGAVALAAMATDPGHAGDQFDAWQSFGSGAPINRIDFIDTGLDTTALYPYFGGRSPSVAMYEDYFKYYGKAGIEFNYITEHTSDILNNFFDNLQHNSLFQKHNKPAGALGDRKFSFTFNEAGPNSFVSMHVAAKDKANVKGKVGYAFTMINDYGTNLALRKNDSVDSISTSQDSVPDHAEACSKSQAASDAAKIQKKLAKLEERIFFFETFLTNFISQGSGHYCSEEESEISAYSIYCDGKSVKTSNSSRFFTDYLKYLTNKKDYAELGTVSQFETQFLSSNLYKPNLVEFKEGTLKPFLTAAEIAAEGVSKVWEELYKRFDRDTFSQEGFITSTLNTYATTMAAPDAYKKMIFKVDNTIEKIASRTVRLDPECAPPPMVLGNMLGGNTNGDGENPLNIPNVTNSDSDGCSGKQIVIPNNFNEIYEMIPYAPDKKRFKISGRSSKIETQLDQIKSFHIEPFDYKARGSSGQVTTANSPPIWSCITNRIANAWESACNVSNYIPFSVVQGIRGYGDYEGNTAYNYGMSLHAFGLAIDVDPPITGYSKNGSPVYSVYTGAWSAAFLANHARELYDLGVFKTSPYVLMKNAYQGENELRMVENWHDAPNSYKGAGESGGQRDRYKKIMNAAKGSPIVPPGANPTKWLVTFCETSGMRWGNAKFMKKRWRGGNKWNSAEKKKIAKIYGIPNIVDRIKALSWKTTSVEDHMHLHFWTGKSLIPWAQIVATKKRVG